MNANTIRVWRQTLFLLLLSIVAFTGHSQDYYEQFTKKDGLPSNECYDTYQDHNGLIWIATDRGLASFDGNSFKTYGITDGLPNSVVLEFFPQPHDGSIWCTTTSNELFHFHPDKMEFKNYKYNHILNEIRGGQPLELAVEKDASISFRSKVGPSFCKINADGSKYIENHKITSSGETMNVLHWHDGKKPCLKLENLQKNYDGLPLGSNFLVGHSRISSFNSSTLISANHLIILVENKVKPNIKKIIHKTPLILNSGSTKNGFWVGFSNGGVECYDALGNITHHYAKNKSVTNLYEDNFGGIWLTTQSSGVLYYPPVIIDHLKNTENLKVRHLSKGANDQLVFADNIGHLYELSDNGITRKTLKNNLPCAQTYDDPWGFYSNEDELSFYSEVSQRILDVVILRFSDARNKKPLLISPYSIFDPNGKSLYLQTIKNPNRIRTSDAEYLGDDLVISKSDSVLLWGPDNTLKRSIGLKNKINELDVHDAYILCATAGDGLVILNNELQIINRITTSDGLLSNFINEVFYHDGILWIGTYNGLARVTNPFAKPKIEVISTTRGILSDEIFDMEILGDSMYLGTSSGIFFFHLKDWSKIAEHTSTILFKLDKFLVNGKQVSSLLELNHSENPIEVYYNLYSYEERSHISFRYKLIGLDNKWNETADRKVVFNSLPPGEYKLVIQPIFNGVPRNETIRQKITVLPPYYSTWWFISILIVGIIVGTWLFIHYRVFAKNRELIREILRFIMKRLRPESLTFVVRSEGKDIRINSQEVLFAESNGNYLTIHTKDRKVVIREKISNFGDLVPDKLEYVQVRRSVIVRKDKITGKNSDYVIVGNEEIKIGTTFKKDLGDFTL